MIFKGDKSNVTLTNHINIFLADTNAAFSIYIAYIVNAA